MTWGVSVQCLGFLIQANRHSIFSRCQIETNRTTYVRPKLATNGV